MPARRGFPAIFFPCRPECMYLFRRVDKFAAASYTVRESEVIGLAQVMEMNLFDEHTGQQELHVVKRRKPKLGRGWMAFYKKALKRLIKEVPNLSTLKVYLWLASKQTYQKFVMTTQKQIQLDLKMSNSTVYESIKWLRENKYLQSHDVEGNSAFLLNAQVTTCGATSMTKKRELWLLQEHKDELQRMDADIAKKQEALDKLNGFIAALTTSDDADTEDEEEINGELDSE